LVSEKAAPTWFAGVGWGAVTGRKKRERKKRERGGGDRERGKRAWLVCGVGGARCVGGRRQRERERERERKKREREGEEGLRGGGR
jgi:hypothetical protein